MSQSSLMLVALLIVFVVLSVLRNKSTGRRYPPALPGLPIVGNTLQAPKSHLWIWLEDIARKYGPMVRLNIAGDQFLLLSKPEDAEELLSKRSSTFSGRKQAVFAAKYRSNNKRMLLLPHGEELRKQRAMFKLLLRPGALVSYHRREEQQIIKLLYELLNKPTEYHKHLYSFTAGIIMGITYGHQVHEGDDDIAAILRSNASFNLDALPGAHIVDNLPWLDYLPDWLSPWKHEARQKHEEELELFMRLAKATKAKHDSGLDNDSFMSLVWSNQDKENLDDETIAYLGGSAFEAGTSVTACLLHSFLLASINYPEEVAKVQAEIDNVVGDEPPQYEQMRSMPALWSFVKEVLRWVPVTPLAFPHRTDVDTEYKGYYIPEGTLIIPSVWNMHRDPQVFNNPLAFEPSRWFAPNDDNNVDSSLSLVDGIWSFGFGRRECPAKYLAVELAWGAIANILWAFSVDSPTSHGADQKKDIFGRSAWLDGVNIEPTPFAIKLLPRSPARAKRIEQLWATEKPHA